MYKQGFLPVAGGILDQSATFCQAIAIVDREIAEQMRGKQCQKE